MNIRLHWQRSVVACIALGFSVGCGSGLVRRPTDNRHEYSAGVAHIVWRTPIHQYPPSVSKPEECASGALVGSHLLVGSRAGTFLSVNVQTGVAQWTQALHGGVDGEALYDQVRKQVYIGTDDGFFYALRPATGTIRWTYRGKGPMDRRPAIGSQGLFLTTASDRLIAIDPETGISRWQYERETPEGFTIQGYGSPLVAKDRVLAGFSDGYLVALQADSGALIWARSLAAASEQHVDVDATPVIRGETIYAASFLGGIYALRLSDGEVLWRTAMEGTSGLTLGESRLYAAVPGVGLVAMSLEGNILWRRGLADSGDITPPVEIGPYLIWSTSRDGLFIVEQDTGKLLQTFDPARGMCAAPAVDLARRRIYILANNGSLYALGIAY